MMLSATCTSQSLEDKLYAIKYFLSGQSILFVVLKSTTTELIGPKKKHLNYLVNMTNEPNVPIPKLVKHLMRRSRNPEWSIAFKTIITIHHLMDYGNERFIQNLASSPINHRSFESLCSFVDSNSTIGYNMSIFLRRYSRYINFKVKTYLSTGINFCRTTKQQTTGSSGENLVQLELKNMPLDRLLTIIGLLQQQFDTLLAFDASASNLCNGIINAAFSMLYKDFVKLYLAYQSAIIRLLELYFKVQQLKLAREMLEAYKKFLVRMNKVNDFVHVTDAVGMDKRDMPNISLAPEFSLKLLERHLESLEVANNSKRIYATSSAVGRTQSVELPSINYGTLGRPRPKQLRTPIRQTSIDILSPRNAIGYKRRRNSELERLDKMLGFDDKKDSVASSATDKRVNKNCDLSERVEEEAPESTYETLDGSGVANRTITSETTANRDGTFSAPILRRPNENPFETSGSTTTNDSGNDSANSIRFRRQTPFESLAVRRATPGAASPNRTSSPDWVQVEL